MLSNYYPEQILLFLISVTSLWHIISVANSMFITSATIYFGDKLVGYDLFKVMESFELRPAITASGNLIPPTTFTIAGEGSWDITGVRDADIKAQIIKLIRTNHLLKLH